MNRQEFERLLVIAVINFGIFNPEDPYPTLSLHVSPSLSLHAICLSTYQPFCWGESAHFLVDWEGWDCWNQFVDSCYLGYVNALEVQNM
jgi:hypothetical protein